MQRRPCERLTHLLESPRQRQTCRHVAPGTGSGTYGHARCAQPGWAHRCSLLLRTRRPRLVLCVGLLMANPVTFNLGIKMNRRIAFQRGIWHPFGPHGRESPEAILGRKANEIETNGWTLWSFQNRRDGILNSWSSLLSASKYPPVVFCSYSPGARDPSDGKTAGGGALSKVIRCRSYRLARSTSWRAIPRAIQVPHPFRNRKNYASAFVVQRIVNLDGQQILQQHHSPAIRWYSNGKWRTDRVPTRGEYLIRRGGTERMRRVRVALILKAPYLATVCTELPTGRVE